MIKKKQVRLMVTLCDVHSIDSMVTQYCNNNHIPTATLEHGYMNEGPALALSKSDHFLGYGQSVLENALSVGMAESKFKKVGMPQLIGFDVPSALSIHDNKTMGVICNGSLLIDEDIEMLKIATEFSQKYGYKVFVKLHPGSSAADYPQDLINKADRICITEVNINEFAELVQFSLISSSSVFIEYLLHMYPVLHYPSGIGAYNKEKWCEVNSADDIGRKVSGLLNDPEKYYNNARQALQYYTEYEDVAGNYSRFFNSFLDHSPGSI